MTGKKKSGNDAPFWIFSQAKKPYIEKKLGKSLSNDELSMYTSKMWKELDAEERAIYQKKNNIKLDTFGVPVYEHKEQEYREAKLQEDMTTGIRNLVDWHVSGNTLRDLEFITIVVTEYIVTEERQVFPAEISLVRVTLAEGLDPKQYHTIIRPPTSWPLGYEAAVRSQATSTHRIPTDASSPECVGTSNLGQVAMEVQAFLTPHNASAEVLPVYTLGSRLDITRKVMSDTLGLDQVQVWSLEHLLRQVFVALYPDNEGVYTHTHARDDIVNPENSPEFHPKLGCEWHRMEKPDDKSFCSLNMAQRWCYMLLQALSLSDTLDIALVVGCHYPVQTRTGSQLVNLSQYAQKKDRRKREANLHSSTASISQQYMSQYSLEDTAPRQASAAAVCPESEVSPARRQRSRTPPWGTDYPAPQANNVTEFPALGGGGKGRGKEQGGKPRKSKKQGQDQQQQHQQQLSKQQQQQQQQQSKQQQQQEENTPLTVQMAGLNIPTLELRGVGRGRKI